MHNAVSRGFLAINRPLGKANHAISTLGKNIAGLLLSAMLLMILAQVFYRYVLNDSLAWTEELAKYLMVWVACLVAPWAYRENLNVSIEMFADALPKVLRRISEIIITILVIIISALFFEQSVAFWQGGFEIYASSMPVKLAYFYACAPLMFAALFLVGIENLIKQLFARDYLTEQTIPPLEVE
jgi:TRAP-type C4-dicarboxylate transport system permease small subunit